MLEIRGAAPGLLDDPLLLDVGGAAPHSALVWRARLRDDDGFVWRAADPRPEGLSTAWVPAKASAGPVAALRSLRPVDVDVRVEAPDGTAASRTIRRRLLDDGVRTRRWRDDVTGTLHLPALATGAALLIDATQAPQAPTPLQAPQAPTSPTPPTPPQPPTPPTSSRDEQTPYSGVHSSLDAGEASAGEESAGKETDGKETAGAGAASAGAASERDAGEQATGDGAANERAAAEHIAAGVPLAAALLASRGIVVLVVTGGKGDPLAAARERLAALPGVRGDVASYAAAAIPLPAGVGLRGEDRPGAIARAEAWDTLLAHVGARPRAHR